MPSLTVENFSAIKRADIQLHPMTVVVGPQSSGKSVICKLMYFCIQATMNYFSSLEEFGDVEDYRKSLADKFSEWFPPEAWGDEKFSIRFKAGDITIHIYRSSYSGEVSSKVNVRLSRFIRGLYSEDMEGIKAQAVKIDTEARPLDPVEALWSIQRNRRKALAAELGDEYVGFQQFIPAGRSFFTNVGKAISAFEQAKMLEPFTVDFGRYFSLVRETLSSTRLYRRPSLRDIQSDIEELRREYLEPAIGGQLIMEKNREFVKARDGRLISFQHLSSGQQEILPLVLSVLHHVEFYRGSNSILYIEEPEAHLFPTTQDLIVRFLARISAAEFYNCRMIITTHSPYVLAKINNLILAGQIGTVTSKARREIGGIVDQKCWLPLDRVAAYAIVDGEVMSILDGTGLIDGDYLDSVSDTMSEEFTTLLDILNAQ